MGGIDPKRIEVGTTTLSKYGARTHIVHYMYDLKDGVDALSHAKQKFAESAEDVAQALRAHFGLAQTFEVHFEAKESAKRAPVAEQKAVEMVNSGDGDAQKPKGQAPGPTD